MGSGEGVEVRCLPSPRTRRPLQPTPSTRFDDNSLGTVLDAIGIPDSALDEANLVGAALGGTDFVFTGDEPKLVFRDRFDPTLLWAVNDPPLGVVHSAEGTTATSGDFVFGNPFASTFGAVNPTTLSAPANPILINEFEPNPSGSDPASVSIELRGPPGGSFTGSLIAVEANLATPTVNRSNAISGIFDTNGLLVVTISDLENPSFTLVLLENDVPPTLGEMFDVATYLPTTLDAIGIPDSALDEANLVGAALGGTDFVFTGDEPKLVFRDALDPSIVWAVNDPPFGQLINAEGAVASDDDFVFGNPLVPTFGAVNPTSATDVLQGDFNLDGVVNAADYTVWRDGLGTKFTPSDYTLWADNYGITSGPASGTIPEPAAGILWLVALSAFWRNCRRD
ncbi:hypothetical protein Pla111_02450 [Botrimarina hoheduenensis]|uniref:PEP-CTERM protein-sorting domain-containing protein n=1 Tax=Botrimarina hoheduenensis TaxID=2528000 RepID=A0A5C5WDA4_9BACT|nr:hypothetical protein Pla111_02450 [Botrimarina hoheduenensis]